MKSFANILYRIAHRFNRTACQQSQVQYCGAKVSIQRTGYINITALSRTLPGEPNFYEWRASDQAKKIIKDISLYKRLPPEALFNSPQDAPEDVYVHPTLVPHILSWLSPKFAAISSDVINKYFIREITWAEVPEEPLSKDGPLEHTEVQWDILNIIQGLNASNEQMRENLEAIHQQVAAIRQSNDHMHTNFEVIHRRLAAICENTSK